MAVALVHPATDDGPDTLEKTVAFLQKRDGIDKVHITFLGQTRLSVQSDELPVEKSACGHCTANYAVVAVTLATDAQAAAVRGEAQPGECAVGQ